MRSLRIVGLVLTVSTLGLAQQLIHRSTVPTAPFTETDANHPTTPLPDVAPNSSTFRIAPLPSTPFPLGDLAFDNVTGRIWETNGFLIQATPSGRYAPLAPAVPPVPSGTPPLTGLAIDGGAGILYATEGTMLFKLFAMPPFPAAGPPVPLAFPAIAPPYTGLHYDPGVDLIFACDAGGYVYYFATDGTPSGPNPVFVPPGPVPPATDLAAPGVTALPGMYVQFVGLGVIDYTSALIQPAAFNGIPTSTEGGLAFHAYPAIFPGSCPCAGSYGPMMSGCTAPTIVGSPTFAFRMTGGPMGSTVLFGLDFSTSPIAIGGGCTFWLPILPWLLVTASTDATGMALMPIAIPDDLGIVGISVSAQWGAPCATNPSGYVVSNAVRTVLIAK